MIEKVSFTISVINNAMRHKKKSIVVQKFDTRVIKVLKELNFINYVIKINCGFYISINQSISEKFKIINYHRRHSKIKMSPTQITKLKLNHQTGLYIYITPKGFVDQHHLVRNKMTGVLAFQIVLR